MTRRMLLPCAAAALLPVQVLAQGADLEGMTWTEQKCAFYDRAFDDAVGMVDAKGLSAAFLAQNEAFVAGGCTEYLRICPTSAQEYRLVDILTLMTMNEGMASTFVPFGCPQ
jgi:hypothetical protein